MMKVLAAMATILVFVGSVSAQFGGARSKGQSQLRELTGMVMDRNEAPIDQAIVYLKNSRTLVVKTFITGKDGKYRFPALAQNVDYDIYAEVAGKRSDTKTLSSFDSRSQANINLRVDVAK